MNKKKRQNIINIAAIFVCSFLVIFLLIYKDFWNIVQTISTAKWIFLVIAVAVQCISSLCDGLSTMILSRRYRRDYTYKEGLINSMIGLFFCFITPSATGGQFAQIYVFNKQGIKVEKSASVLIVNFIAYELVVILFSFFTLVFNYNYMSTTLMRIPIFGMNISFIVLAIIGFVINLGCVVAIVTLAYSKVANKFVHFCIKVLAKVRIVKSVANRTKIIDDRIQSFRENLADIRGIRKQFLAVCSMNIIKLTTQFSIPFFCALALGVKVEPMQILIIIALSSYLQLITSFIPIPGSSGGSEFFFYLLFTPIFGAGGAVLASAMIIWRLITFYIPLIYCGLITFVFNKDRKGNLLDYVPTRHLWFFYRNMSKALIINDEENIDENYYK